MIKEKTVFIFGAGLSSDYQFPTGHQLRDKITDLLKWNIEGPIPNHIQILERMNCYPEEINGFREQLEDGGFDTIDEFLEARENQRYRFIGKVAIAMALISYENPNTFKRRSSNNCFYRFLFRRMVEGATKETFEDNKVSIVTYNYDRSFEFFLWKALLGRYEGIEKQEVDNIMKKIKIVHVHGMLGQMRWQSSDFRDYSPVLDHVSVLLASRGIVSFNEIDGTHIGYREARNEIAEAKNVVFVGFGFHHLNLSRLIDGGCLAGKKRILATTIGLSDVKKVEINKLTEDNLIIGNMKDYNAVQFANNYLNWL